MAEESDRIVVTGVGAVSPYGIGHEVLWQGLAAGKNAVTRLPFPHDALPVRVGASVPDFDPDALLGHRTARRTARFGQFALVAAREALAMSGLDLSDPEVAEETGVVIGTAGGLFQGGDQEQVLQARGARRVDPLYLSKWAGYMAAVRVGMELGLHGVATTVNSACASGLDAIGQAMHLVRVGRAERILAGGTEAILNPLAVAVLGQIGALTRREDPEGASRPFDRERDGFVLAEGAGVLVLERESRARARGAPILAEVAGAGWSFDARDETAPDAAGQALAMRRALADAGVRPQEVDWVKAHGTSTVLNDRTETAAIKAVLGEAAYRVPVSSMKSMIGHAASASGAMEAVAAVSALRHGLIPPTAHLEHPDPECDLDYVPGRARPAPLRTVLLNAFGLGGQNACIVLRRWDGAA
ncbi:MAG: beta-ketoacyl-[acyl-carrier-protein] synthase family protein [Firmicutes bacterium]|nr:beta-ketoacyl-[acyl-carrier-protein] synthase family protein [Bacillota bacterium]